MAIVSASFASDPDDLYLGQMNSDWNTVHNAAAASATLSASTAEAIVAGVTVSGADRYIFRGIVIFDTSAIAGSILSASLSLNVTTVTNPPVSIRGQAHSGLSTPPSVNDYDVAKWSGNYFASTLNATAYLTFPLSDATIVNLGGTTVIGIRQLTNDVLDVDPGLTNSMDFSSGDDVDPADRPILTITYEDDPATGGPIYGRSTRRRGRR